MMETCMGKSLSGIFYRDRVRENLTNLVMIGKKTFFAARAAKLLIGTIALDLI
jgi:hypothetical protein